MNLAGKILISPPNVRGNFWAKSVIYVTEHHDRGSMGITLNKRSKMTIREFAEQCDVNLDIDGYMYVGGPVNVKALTMLHSPEWSCSNTMRINKQFSLSSSEDLLEKLAMGHFPKHWRLFVGLCAWAPDQLEAELKGLGPHNHNYSWLIATPTYTSVFNLDNQDQWTSGIEQSGTEFVQNLLA